MRSYNSEEVDRRYYEAVKKFIKGSEPFSKPFNLIQQTLRYGADGDMAWEASQKFVNHLIRKGHLNKALDVANKSGTGHSQVFQEAHKKGRLGIVRSIRLAGHLVPDHSDDSDSEYDE